VRWATISKAKEQQRIKHNKIHLTVYALLVLCICIVYIQVYQYEFTNYDDDIYVEFNPHIKDGFTVEGLKWVFIADLFRESPFTDFWAPVTLLSRMIDMQIYQYNAGGHHITNLLIHIVNAILLYLLLYRMTGCVWRSAVVAALFALHPLRVESVAWITERKDVLSGMFWILTLIAYLRHQKKPATQSFMLVFICILLGMLSKPMVVTLPVVLILMDVWPAGRVKLQPLDVNTLKTSLNDKVPLLLLAAGIMTIAFKSAEQSIGIYNLKSELLHAPVSYVWYIVKMFYPLDLSIRYPHAPGNAVSALKVIASSALLIAVTVVAFRNSNKRPYLIFGWLWFLITLIPMVFGISVANVADRHTYVAHIGLYIMLVWGIYDMAQLYKLNVLPLKVITIAAITILMVLSFQQVKHWQNSFTLYEHAIKISPNDHLLYDNLGRQYESDGRYTEAAEAFGKSLEIYPANTEVLHSLGLMYEKMGVPDKAVGYYRQALMNDPLACLVHGNFADLLMKLKSSVAVTTEFTHIYQFELDKTILKMSTAELDRVIYHYGGYLRCARNDRKRQKLFSQLQRQRKQLDANRS